MPGSISSLPPNPLGRPSSESCTDTKWRPRDFGIRTAAGRLPRRILPLLLGAPGTVGTSWRKSC